MKTLRWTILFYLFIAGPLGLASSLSPSVDGSFTNANFLRSNVPDLWRSTVQIYQHGNSCGGVFVKPRVLLTVAHCAFSEGLIDVAFFKPSGAFSHIERTSAIQVYENPAYEKNGPSAHDIAFVVFKENLLPQGYQLADFLTPESPALEAALLLVNLRLSNEIKNIRLQPLNARVKGYEDEGTALYTVLEGSDSMCVGDSGGPAFAKISSRQALIGVISTIAVWDKETEQCSRTVYISRLSQPDLDWLRNF